MSSLQSLDIAKRSATTTNPPQARKTIEVANGMGGPNSIAFGKDGRLFVSEVFIGDALYEIDLKNVDKPDFKPAARGDLRRIAEKMGGLNGFDFGPDGLLYGPLWFKGQIVKIDVDKATLARRFAADPSRQWR